MIKSMTGYGRSKRQIGGWDILVEIKSVNNRYLDCSVKVPRLFGFMEEKVKEYITKKGISRGKVDVFLTIDILENDSVEIGYDKAYAKSYIDALKKLGEEFDLKDDMSLMRVAQNHDIFVIKKSEEDIDAEWAKVLPVLEEAVDAFVASRIKEGQNMKNDIASKKETVMELAHKIAPISKENSQNQFVVMQEKIKSLAGDITIDENRLLTECAIYADKIAIDEELVRLESHFSAFDDILKSEEPVGRKLDFLLQEMNRETNTIGSKSSDAQIAKYVIDIKCELEKIREQIQNIE